MKWMKNIPFLGKLLILCMIPMILLGTVIGIMSGSYANDVVKKSQKQVLKDVVNRIDINVNVKAQQISRCLDVFAECVQMNYWLVEDTADVEKESELQSALWEVCQNMADTITEIDCAMFLTEEGLVYTSEAEPKALNQERIEQLFQSAKEKKGQVYWSDVSVSCDKEENPVIIVYKGIFSEEGEMIQYRKTNYVVEADIRGFFDNVDHEWLMKMLRHDIADKRFLELVEKFLKAGIMENGKYLASERGTPQGNGASPILANIYLHYVLDNWFDVIVKRQCNGECYLIRYCDDFVCCFQNEYEARVFREKLEERFAKYGLELAEEKTKILEFGRFAKQNRERRGKGKPNTFDFLGFTFYCGMDGKKRFFRCRVKTSKKKLRSKIRAMKEWIMNHRMLPLKWIFKTVNAKIRGHYQYYGVTDNTREVKTFLCITKKLLFKWLNRRSQKRSYTWENFNNGLLKTFPLLEPSIKVSLFYR